MLTDPISDMLTRLRNALAVGKREVTMPYSNVKLGIAKILAHEGFVATAEKVSVGSRSALRVGLKYNASSPAIRGVKRVSTPGRRVYAKFDALPRVMSDMGIAIVSTPNGLMTNKEARARHLGGEVICEVY
jgi:small subunit ribosomal protein S8